MWCNILVFWGFLYSLSNSINDLESFGFFPTVFLLKPLMHSSWCINLEVCLVFLEMSIISPFFYLFWQIYYVLPKMSVKTEVKIRSNYLDSWDKYPNLRKFVWVALVKAEVFCFLNNLCNYFNFLCFSNVIFLTSSVAP